MPSGTQSSRTVARFGLVFRLLETVVPWARRLRSGLCIRVVNCVQRHEGAPRVFHSPWAAGLVDGVRGRFGQVAEVETICPGELCCHS